MNLILLISVELMGLESKLTTYLESALQTESTYMCSKLFFQHFFSPKKFIRGPLKNQSKNQFHEKVIRTKENRFRAYKMLAKYKGAYN